MITLDTDQLVSAWLHLFGAELDRTVANGHIYTYTGVGTRTDHHLAEFAERLPKTPEPAASGHVIDELVTHMEYTPDASDRRVPRREASVPRAALIEAAEKAVNALEVPERVALFQGYPTSAVTALATRPAPYSARQAIAETDLPSDMSSADAIRTLWGRLRAKI